MTLNESLDIPPISFKVKITNPVPSEPVYSSCVNLTFISVIKMHALKGILVVINLSTVAS